MENDKGFKDLGIYRDKDFKKIVRDFLILLDVGNVNEMHDRIKDLSDYRKSTSQFIECIINLVSSCAPPGYFKGKKPNLKYSW
jgi:hypothetical protein